ncbi:MAG: Fic family protein [Chloroflexi bacterium]|nr:Fic family protein [Chloroflexota bacterium]
MRLTLTFNEEDEDIKMRLAFADQRRYVIRALVPEGYESYFQDQARYTSAHASTAIEGNPMSPDEAMKMLATHDQPDSSEGQEKVNLDEAYELAAQLAADKSTDIDQGLIRTLNSIIQKSLPDPKARGRGKYRVGQSFIIDKATRDIKYRPPAAEDVPELMDDYVTNVAEWIDRLPGPIAAALAHFGLISIHPFEDGNGRTARLVADMVLDLTSWSVESMLSVSQAILDDHAGYIAALAEAQGKVFTEDVDVTPFVRFHTRMLAMSAAFLEEKVIRFNQRRDEFIENSDELNERQVTGLMFMLDIGPISSSRYAKLNHSSQSSAISDLTDLLNDGVVKRLGTGKTTRYDLEDEVRRHIEMGSGEEVGAKQQ